MRNYFYYNGKSSADFDFYVANKNQFNGARKRVETFAIPGRNGTLSIADGSYENQDVTYTMYGSGDIRENLRVLRDFLGSVSGYAELTDTYDPEYYQRARYAEGLQVQTSDRKNASFDLVFDCDPRKFLKNGKRMIEITSGAALKNPFKTTAKPLIRAYGTGTIMIGSTTVQVTAADVYTDIDSEIENAYKGPVNCNSNIVLNNFPVLLPGINNISFTGFSKVEIRPNWWTI